MGGTYDAKKTACAHGDVDYIPQLRGLSEAQVRARVLQKLADHVVIDDDADLAGILADTAI